MLDPVILGPTAATPVSLPDPVEARIKQGAYASARGLVRTRLFRIRPPAPRAVAARMPHTEP